jgi:WD40 repeat protein
LLAAVALAGSSSPAANTTADAGGYWIVLASDRDGTNRGYSVRPDGGRLSPLGSSKRALAPLAVSAGGGTIAYTDSNESIWVSRANGTGLRRLANGVDPALSRDGSQLAFKRRRGCCTSTIWTVRTDGRGLRRISSGPRDGQPDWSPDGTKVVFSASDRAIVVRSLDGSRRVLARGPLAFFNPRWSPDGHWIAYVHYEGFGSRRNGLFVTHPDGSQRHRVARVRDATAFAWSPESRRLAMSDLGRDVLRLAVFGVDGRGSRQLHLEVVPASFPRAAVAWSPDGRQLIFAGHAGDDSDQIWVVGTRGGGLRRLTNAGSNAVVGLTRHAPALPPARPLVPSERVLSGDAVVTRGPIVDLSADATRVTFLVGSTRADCGHVALWRPPARTLSRFALLGPCVDIGSSGGPGDVYEVELAGSRVTWASYGPCGNFCDVTLKTTTLDRPVTQVVDDRAGAVNGAANERWDYRLRGDGDLLVFDDVVNRAQRLVRIGTGRERCGVAACTTLRRGAHAVPVDSVSEGRIAVREPDEVAVVDAQGALVRVFPFATDEVSAARLDGSRLVVARLALLDVYDVTTGIRELSRPFPSGFTLAEVDGGIAVLRRGDTIRLLRLADGASHTLTPGRGVLADLEAAGLYYSSRTGAGGRLAFMSRAELIRQLS